MLPDMLRQSQAAWDRKRQREQTQQQIPAFPSRWSGGGESAAPVAYLRIQGGNTLQPGSIAGIKKLTTVLAATASDRDPGTTATATVTVSGGVVTAITIVNGGSVYDSASISYTPADGLGVGFSGSLTISGNAVTAGSVSNGGSGYTDGTFNATISAPNGTPDGLPWEDGLGYGLLYTVTSLNPLAFNISRVLIVNDQRAVTVQAVPTGTDRSVLGQTFIDITAGGTERVYFPWAT